MTDFSTLLSNAEVADTGTGADAADAGTTATATNPSGTSDRPSLSMNAHNLLIR